MGCVVVVIAMLMPRIVMIFIAIFTNWFSRAFDSVLIPILGFFFMPYTTLVWMAGAINGGVRGWWVVLVVLAAMIDVIHWGRGGGRYSAFRRKRPII